jgi:WD40 repeat protein
MIGGVGVRTENLSLESLRGSIDIWRLAMPQSSLTRVTRTTRLLPSRCYAIIFVSLVACAPALSGCGSSEPAADEPGGQTGSTLSMDGFVLLHTGTGLRLLDPETGKESLEEYPTASLPRPHDGFSVSPDGRRIAYLATEASPRGPNLIVAEVVLADGAPALKTVSVYKDDLFHRPRWSPDGLRIFTQNVAIDPATDQIWPCHEDVTTAGVTLDAIVSIPGGHRYVCPEAGVLKSDGAVLAPIVEGKAVTADGQFYSPGVHAQSGTTRAVDGVTSDRNFSNLARTALPDASIGVFPSGRHGKVVVAEAAGFVTTYKVIEVTDPPVNGTLYDLKSSFESGTLTTTAEWSVRESLLPFMNDGEGRGYDLRGVSGDGQRALYTVGSWRIDDDHEHTNVLYQTATESALIFVDRAGSSRGFKTSDLGRFLVLSGPDVDLDGALQFQPELLTDLGGVDFGEGDFLSPVGSEPGSSGIGWGGYLKGKPHIARDAGRMSLDGRWFFKAGQPSADQHHSLCVRAVEGNENSCIGHEHGGDPVAIVGYGLKPEHTGDAPEILMTSRLAAWPGSPVIVHGVRFGSSGVITVGGVAVDDSAVVEWSDTQLVFKFDEQLPSAGQIVVETDAGKGGVRRAFWLHGTDKVQTPFDGLSSETHSLGQGLNVVDVGDVELGQRQTVPEGLVDFSAASRRDDGKLVVFSAGAERPTDQFVSLKSGAFEHHLHFRLENRMAEGEGWQLVRTGGEVDPATQRPRFVRIAGDLVEHASAVHPTVGERVLFSVPQPRLAGTAANDFGIPDYWREAADGKSAWIINNGALNSRSLKHLTGWSGAGVEAWGQPQFGMDPVHEFGSAIRGVEAAAQQLLVTGYDEAGAAFALGSVAGSSPGLRTSVAATLARANTTLREPIRVEATGGTFFLVFESPQNAPGLVGVHGVSTAGTFTANVAEIPTGVQLASENLTLKTPLTYVNEAGKLLVHFPHSNTLLLADFDASGDDPKPWATLPSAADAGHVLGIWHDAKEQAVYAVKDDGQVMRAATAHLGDAVAWKSVDLGIELALPIKVRPIALSRLEDGRWFVFADLRGGAPSAAAKEASPFGASGFLLGPSL